MLKNVFIQEVARYLEKVKGMFLFFFSGFGNDFENIFFFYGELEITGNNNFGLPKCFYLERIQKWTKLHRSYSLSFTWSGDGNRSNAGSIFYKEVQMMRCLTQGILEYSEIKRMNLLIK